VDRLAVGLATKASAVLANAQRGAEARAFAERAVRSAGTAAVRGLALTALADALRIEGKDLAAARAAAEESVEILRGEPAMRGELAAALNNLGIVLQDVGEVEPGIVALEEAVAINAEVGADRTYKAMYELHNLSALQRTAGRMPEAERHARSALAIVERLAGNDHPHRATVLANLALALRGQRRLEEAEAVQREGLATLERAGLGSGPDAGIAWLNLASLLRDRADMPGAIEAGRRAVEVLDAIPGQDAWLRAAARMSFGRALSAAGRHAEAEPPLREAWELLEPMPIDARRRSAGLLALFQACRAWNEQDPEAMPDDRVEQLRSAVREFDAANPGVIPAGSW
jgi:tetratricopeptide (TPR) repeat protein